jgi:hypothetical protein
MTLITAAFFLLISSQASVAENTTFPAENCIDWCNSWPVTADNMINRMCENSLKESIKSCENAKGTVVPTPDVPNPTMDPIEEPFYDENTGKYISCFKICCTVSVGCVLP